MFYLASNTRPDLSFAVHKCVRFTHNTKESCETDVKRICRYLQGIKDNGLVFNTSKKMMVDFYADTDFVGLWGHENLQDSICVRIGTGFVVIFPILLYCGCQKYRQSLIFIKYIMSMCPCLILLERCVP